METSTQDQIRALQTSLRRQRYAIVALSGIVAWAGLSAATRPVGDATFDTVTCKEWVVVDKDGKARISASALPNGSASVFWRDRSAKLRIVAGTGDDGQASVRWYDNEEGGRIDVATTAFGQASIQLYDKESKPRLDVSTFANGQSGIQWYDKERKQRISAGILKDGSVVLPTVDLNR